MMRKREIAGFAALCVLMGSMWIPERALAGEVSMGYALAIANSIGAAMTLVLCLLLQVRRPQGREWFSLLMVCCASMASIAVLYMAEMLPFHLSPLDMLSLHASSPLGVILLTPLWLGISVPRRAMLPMLAGFGGVLLLLSVALQFSWGGAFDAVFGFIAILCTVSSFLYASRVLGNVSPLISASAVMLCLSALAWPLVIVSDSARRNVDWTDTTVAALLLTTCALCACMVLGFWLLQRVSPYKLVMVRIGAPVVMMAEAWAIVREWPEWRTALGAVVALACVVVVLGVQDSEEEPISLFYKEQDAQPAELH